MDRYKSLKTFHFAEEIRKDYADRRLRALIFGNFGAGNQGDEAILAGELQELRKLSNVTITVVARNHEEVKRLHKVRGISLYNWTGVLSEIRKSDFVIVGGGGLINKMERGLIGFLYQLYMLLLFFFSPTFYKKNLYVLGVGVYSNANPIILGLAKMLMEKAKIVTVRDEHSYHVLSSLEADQAIGSEASIAQARRGSKRSLCNHRSWIPAYAGMTKRGGNDKVKLYKDNSFLMDLSPISEVRSDSFFKQNFNKDRLQIGLSLLQPEDKDEEERLLKELATFIVKNSDKADFWFYSLDTNPSYVNDEKFGRKLLSSLEANQGSKRSRFAPLDSRVRGNDMGEVRFHFVPVNWSPQKVFSSFKLMDYVVAMRFHGAVFAYRNGINFTGISYDKKCESFIRSVGKDPVEIGKVTWKKLMPEIGRVSGVSKISEAKESKEITNSKFQAPNKLQFSK